MEGKDPKIAQFTHPSDFEKSSIPTLSDLDNVLRCQVCKDYFETPSMTSCSHTFCSMCIRQALSSSGQCPTCRKKDQTVHLRRNWPIQEAVAAWKKVRADVLQAVTATPTAQKEIEDSPMTNGTSDQQEAPAVSTSKKRAIESVDDAAESPRYKTRSKRQHDPNSDQSHSALEGLNLNGDDEKDADYQDEVQEITPAQAAQAGKAVKVPCPICGEQMLESYVFAHLDHCTGTKSSTEAPAPSSRPDLANKMIPSMKPSQPAKTPFNSNTNIERISFLSYDMMKEAALKKKLQQLGIRTDGNKALMKARHMYWVDLWNANADSDTPRPRRELLDDLAVWERAIGRNHSSGPNKDSSASGIMRKDFDREGYRSQNTNQFNDLIAQARSSIKSKAPTPSDSGGSRTSMTPSAPEPAASMFLGAAAQLNAATAARRGSNAIQYLPPAHLQHSGSSSDSPIRQMPLYQVQEHVVRDMDEDIK